MTPSLALLTNPYVSHQLDRADTTLLHDSSSHAPDSCVRLNMLRESPSAADLDLPLHPSHSHSQIDLSRRSLYAPAKVQACLGCATLTPVNDLTVGYSLSACSSRARSYARSPLNVRSVTYVSLLVLVSCLYRMTLPWAPKGPREDWAATLSIG